MSKSNYLYITIVLLIVCLVSSAFIVKETETAIVTEFGKPKKTLLEPGLYFRIPFIQKVMKFESRVLEWDGDVTEIPTYDKKFIFVDTFARWKISDPLAFYIACVDENGAQSKIGDIINGAIRDEITQRYMPELIRVTDKVPWSITVAYKDKNNNAKFDRGEETECDQEAEIDCYEAILELSGARDEIIENIFQYVSLLVNIKYIDEPYADCGLDGECPTMWVKEDKKCKDDNGCSMLEISNPSYTKPDTGELNGEYDLGENFSDFNGDGYWTSIESYDDKNKNGSYDEGEIYTDSNQNKKYDSGVDNPDFLNLGVEVLDVQIKRLRYTSTVEQEVFKEMISEQYEIAERYRAKGEAKKLEILGSITKEEKRILSEAYKEAQTIKGKADASAIRIYADAYGKNEDFYNFYKSLETYKNTLDPSTVFILSTDSKYLRYLEK